MSDKPKWVKDATEEIRQLASDCTIKEDVYWTAEAVEAIILKHCPVRKLSSEDMLNNLAKVLSECDPSEGRKPDAEEEAFLRRSMQIVNDWHRKNHRPEDGGVGLVEACIKMERILSSWSAQDVPPEFRDTYSTWATAAKEARTALADYEVCRTTKTESVTPTEDKGVGKLVEACDKMAGFLTAWKDCLSGLQMTAKEFDDSSGLREACAALDDYETFVRNQEK